MRGQVENELGFLNNDNQGYLRHLVATTRQHLGQDVVIYTTDPPPNVQKGSLPGAEVFTCATPISLVHCSHGDAALGFLCLIL